MKTWCTSTVVCTYWSAEVGPLDRAIFWKESFRQYALWEAKVLEASATEKLEAAFVFQLILYLKGAD